MIDLGSQSIYIVYIVTRCGFYKKYIRKNTFERKDYRLRENIEKLIHLGVDPLRHKNRHMITMKISDESCSPHLLTTDR